MRRHRRRHHQRGGDGYGYTGAAFAPAGGMAPVEARAAFSHCGFPARPGSLVGGARRRSRRYRKQRGGACGSCSAPAVLLAQQSGGGAATGGYGFVLNNDIGKVYSSLSVGSCDSVVAQRGGADAASSIVSYPAGYGYAPESAVEVGGGTAHYLNQISYGRQCMGGGRRRHHRSRKQKHRQ